MILKWESDGSAKFIPQNDHEKGFLVYLAEFRNRDFTLIANGDPTVYGIKFKPIEDES